MSELFKATTVKNMRLSNRFVRSGTWMGMADPDGSCSAREIDVIAQLAEGGVGLIITGYAYVHKAGKAVIGQMGCYDDHLLPRLASMTDAVHKAGGKIALQIVHGGLFSSAELTGKEILGPSAMQTEDGPLGREMTAAEIEDTVSAFAAAASRAQEAGFDGVQIHSAHGYLLNQFLSPFFNKRTDGYGGSLENRARLLLQVVKSVQAAVGDAYPVLVKLNTEDLLDGGLGKEEMVEVCAMLQQAGIDGIELSAGTPIGLVTNRFDITPFPTGNGKVLWRDAAEQYKKKIDVPLLLVGGIRSYETAERLLEDGVADYVSMCRPLIREPDLIRRWSKGDRSKADCVSDNACIWPGVEGKGVHCVHLDQ